MPSIDQPDLFAPARAPVLVAWGAGVDSTAVILRMLELEEPIDCVLFSDTGGETPLTMTMLAYYSAVFEAHGIPVHVVRYQPKNFKNYPPYSTLEQNCLSNACLPSIAYGRNHSCSLKWKAAPQDKWTSQWQPAIDAWAAGGKVTKIIGYDASPRDRRRFMHAQSRTDGDPKFSFRYPLIEWNWSRDDCIAYIERTGHPVPPKSSCFFCPSSKPHEIDVLPKHLLRRIILMEARAHPRHDPEKMHGLWRKPVKGMRGATPRPGSMTQYIRDQGLLPSDEIDAIISSAPTELIAYIDAAGAQPVDQRPTMTSWIDHFWAINAAST
jgi:hypothetical protein